MEMGRLVMEYCLNAMWLVPVVAGAAWLLVKVARLRPLGEHWVWLGALVVCLTLPAVGTRRPQLQGASVVLEPHRFSASAEPVQSDFWPVASQSMEAASAEAAPAERASVEPASLKSMGVEFVSPNSALATQREWLLRRLHEVPMTPGVMAWFGWVYAGVVGFAAFRLVRVWWAALRLVREASPYAMNEAERAVFRELGSHFGVKLPAVLLSRGVRSPVVVGVWRTVLLLPAGFAQCSEAERRAALCHELGHVRRRDCLVHAGVQVLMLPLVWHPATHVAARRIARTREMVCDQMAADAMSSGEGELTYARCLLNLATRMSGEGAEALAGVGLGLFRTNKLEERVMRLTEAKQVLGVREMLARRVGGVAVATAVLVAGAMVHVAPVVAQESSPVAPGSPIAPPAPASAVPAPAAPAAPKVAAARQVAVAPVAPAPPAAPDPIPQPHPAPAPAPDVAGSATRVGDASSFRFGPMVPDARFNFPGPIFQDDHGEHVMVKDGSHIHQWVGADGERYEVRDAQSAPYTREQERAAEAEYKRKMVQAQAEIDKAQKTLNSPEFKAQLDLISSKANRDAMARAEAELAKAAANFNSPEFKAQMAQLNSPEFKARMDAQSKAIEAQIHGKAFQDQIAQLNSAEFSAKMAEAERQASLVNTPEMEQKLNDAAKRMDEASARLEAATKALAEAQKRLQEQTAK